ncbi:hypothetical protein IWQ62_002207 [Dispira parvispora]|uniref:ABC transporter domain-containing protein n=1 Tax=Dispira parvispora TaxID=1520584 RepID=A0A9W8AW55_9FUNG|nr:hypothetical protein IWQ62_002207 [Dispira parvispora]
MTVSGISDTTPNPSTLGQQYKALLIMQVKNVIRHPSSVLLGVVFPVVTVILAVVFYKSIPPSKTEISESVSIPFGSPSYFQLGVVIEDKTLDQPWDEVTTVMKNMSIFHKNVDQGKNRFRTKKQLSEWREQLRNEKDDQGRMEYFFNDITSGYIVRAPSSSSADLNLPLSYSAMYPKSYEREVNSLIHTFEYANQRASIPTDVKVPFFEATIQTFPSLKWEAVDTVGMVSTALVVYGLAFVAVTVAFFQVYDRETGIKHHLIASGALEQAWYLSSFTRDIILYIIPALLGLICFYVSRIPWFSQTSIVCYLQIILVSGLDVVLAGYLLALLITRSDNVSTLGSFLLTFIVFLPAVIIEGTYEFMVSHSTIYLLTALVPLFGLTHGVRQLSYNAYHDRAYVVSDAVSFQRPLLGMTLIVIIRMILLSFLILQVEKWRSRSAGSILSWSGMLDRIRGKSSANASLFLPKDPALSHDVCELDEEVMREKARLKNTQESTDDVVKILGLNHHYSRGPRKAPLHVLRDLWFGVRPGECFGYLGPNGAGKTTSMKILTGALHPTGGMAYIAGHSVVPFSLGIRTLVGLCPQFDILWPRMTGKEHLHLFAVLRGIPSADITEAIDQVAHTMGLEPVLNQQTRRYSGGNKRRLSLAMACIGNPPVIFLDEPTTGVDVKIRRSIWEAIRLLKRTSSVVLTTHSMEEAEAICDRVGIIVNGNLKCLGTPQRLKNVYGKGWKVMLKARSIDDIGEITRRMCSIFYQPGNLVTCQLKQQLQNYVEFEFIQSPSESGAQRSRLVAGNRSNRLLGPIFGALEQLKHRDMVQDYSVSQTTLSQVFINFARQQG